MYLNNETDTGHQWVEYMLPLLASCANTFSELVPGSMPGVKG
jgi:hypothetical protein